MSPFVYHPNLKIDIYKLFILVFDMGDDDQVCMDIMEEWFDDEEYNKYFKNEGSHFTISPDLEAFNIEFGGDYISISTIIGVMDDIDIVDADLGKFIIRNGIIDRFVYIGDKLKEE